MRASCLRFLFLLVLSSVFLGGVGVLADEATREEYEERLERYDPDTDPGDHKKLASWCKRNYPAKYAYHLRAYNEHVFSGLENGLPVKPDASDYWDLHEKAEKLELHGEAKKYLGLWGEEMFAGYETRMKPGDVTMMKQLFTWCVAKEVAFIESAQRLGEAILEQDPEYAEARRALGHVRWEGDWISRKELIEETIDIRSVDDRIKAHRALAEARREAEREYPTRPFDGMDDLGGIHAFRPAECPDSLFYVCAPGYSSRKPSALVVSLHGGGSGGFEKADEYARIAISEWTRKDDYVAVAPVATNHNVNSWGTRSNVLAVFDALEEICERFNIDRRRIYVTGQSMGGGGTTLWYLCFPEFAAASCARAGWFHHKKRQDKLMSKPILIVQGMKDREDRLESKVQFVGTAEALGGSVKVVDFPDVDHFIPTATVFEQMIPFFEEKVNDIEPDFDVMRAAAAAWITWDGPRQ